MQRKVLSEYFFVFRQDSVFVTYVQLTIFASLQKFQLNNQSRHVFALSVLKMWSTNWTESNTFQEIAEHFIQFFT